MINFYEEKIMLHVGQANQVRRDQKRKSIWRSRGHCGLPNTGQKIECKVKEIERLQESLYELYVSRKPLLRKDSDDICSLHKQVSSVIYTLLFVIIYANWN